MAWDPQQSPTMLNSATCQPCARLTTLSSFCAEKRLLPVAMMMVSAPPELAWPVRLRLTRFAIVWAGTSAALLPFLKQSFPVLVLNVNQPAGHVVLKLISQYCMNAAGT